MEYVVGPVLALLIGMKFSVYRAKLAEERISNIERMYENYTKMLDNMDSETSKKVLKVSVPMVQEINRIKQEIGI